MKEAVLVVDMIKDFVYGKFGSEGAENIIEPLAHFLKEGRERNVPVFFLKDSHRERDQELQVWGQHAMEDEEGSEIVSDLKGLYDVKIEKQHFDGFYDTGLEEELLERDIDKLIITGVSTDICVQHTAAGAFFRGYDIVVLEDCTAAISKEKHEDALEYMKNVYGAEIESSKNIIEKWKERG